MQLSMGHLSATMPSSTGSATGRIDFMGGVADYSGSMVLESPTTVTTTVDARVTNTRDVQLSSDAFEAVTSATFLDFLAMQSQEVELKTVRGWLEDAKVPKWAFYVLGSVTVFYKAALPLNYLW